MKSCFMFGHADCPDSMLPKIEAAIEQYYSQYGVTDFFICYVTHIGNARNLLDYARRRKKKNVHIKNVADISVNGKEDPAPTRQILTNPTNYPYIL